MIPKVTLVGVGHGYRSGQWLFENIDAQFTGGELIAVSGPSGTGKTTLLSILAGHIVPVRGSVIRHGVFRTQWTHQLPRGVPRRSAGDHVLLPLLARGLTRREACTLARTHMAALQVEHLSATPFGRLSGGEAQRVQLARALAAAPELLLVDEPTAQLDRTNAGVLIDCIDSLRSDGRLVLVASHDASLIARATRELRLGT